VLLPMALLSRRILPARSEGRQEAKAMSALDAPQAQAIRNDAILDAQDVAELLDDLQPFLQRYSPHFQRSEQRANARTILQGKLSSLSRKTAEPIAHAAGMRRESLQDFLGTSPWDDDLILNELRAHVREAWCDPNGVLIGDGSGFQKKGDNSCGVKRQYCGRLGKAENCQIGIFLGYSCKHGHTLLDQRLFLPHEWADDESLRERGKIPERIAYQETWEILSEQLDRGRDVPHAWFVCDSEFGKVYAFRDGLRRRGERYAVDIPNDLLIRDLGAPPPE
jgi:SRSO17 transposase